jgi:uncharacterized protein YndB with AHSA1/START domain
MANRVHHKFFFTYPPATVWEYLTKAELMAQWLMENDFQPVVGCDFQFKARPIPALDFDGIVYCKVVEVVPLKRLSYSWKTGPGNGRITVDSLVVWTLHEKEDGTELELEHTGFKEADLSMYATVNEGWLKNIKKIAELINIKYGTTNA